VISGLPNYYRAVLFDLDGTLLDTLDDIGNSMNRVLTRLGLPVHAILSYKQFVGEGMTVLARKALPSMESSDAAAVSKCVALMREEYTSHSMDETKPYPGIPEMLTELGRLQISVAVLSNKPDDMVKTLLNHYFPGTHFNAAFGAQPSFPSKPDPASSLAIAERLKILPERFVFLGDSKIDMLTATAAKMYPVGALWGFRDEAELRTHGAKKLINHPQELLDVVMKTT
jgi:phosphoglycolate phosphatase